MVAYIHRSWIKILLVSLAFLLPGVTFAPSVFAVGDASFSITGSGSTTVGGSYSISVYETSSASDGVNAAQANFTYPTAQLQYVSASIGTFPVCTQQSVSGGEAEFGCAVLSSTVSGTQRVVTLNFTVIAAGTGTARMASGSNIEATGTSVWDGTLSSNSFTFSTPAPAAPSSGSGGSTTKSSGSSTNKAASTPAKTTTPAASTPAAASATPATTNPATQPKPTTAAPVVTAPAGNSGLTLTILDANGKPVANAKVIVDGRFTEMTNAQGTVGFTGLASGAHSVSVTASGKVASHEQLNVGTDETEKVSLQLASAKSPVLGILYVVIGLIVLGGAGYGYLRYTGRKLTVIPHEKPSLSQSPIPASVVTTPKPEIAPALHDPTILTTRPLVVTPSDPPKPEATPTEAQPAPQPTVHSTSDTSFRAPLQ